MDRQDVSDTVWERMAPHLPGKTSDPGRSGQDNRLFVEAVLWLARSGAHWRVLPKEFGRWHTVYQRFNRWCRSGVWENLFKALGDDADFLKFDDHGLVSAIIVDHHDKSVLMFAHMNSEAFAKTQSTGFIHFWGRSRKQLWKKGETSGETFRVVEMRVDCDQDCLLIFVEAMGQGHACHTGRRSCFYRRVENSQLIFD
jgi:putative transposase